MRALRLASLLTLVAFFSMAARAQKATAPVRVSPARINFPENEPLQTADHEGKVIFRTQATLMQIPAIVTNKAGGHVHNLTKDDFRIFENGKEQKISTFEEIVTTNTRLSLPAQTPGEFANLTLSDKEPRAITVIAIDTVNTPFLDQETGRRALIKYLGEIVDPNQVLALAVMSSRGLKTVSGLTEDPNHLVQALKQAGSELTVADEFGVDARVEGASGALADLPSYPQTELGRKPLEAILKFIEREDAIEATFQQQNAIETTMNNFLALAWSLSGVPGRKSVIWVTGGFPFAISSPDVVPGGYLSVLYERALQAFSEANITVYPVDVRGLTNPAVIEAGATRSHSPQDLRRQIGNRSWLQLSSRETLNQFAEMTGGKAFYNSNDLAGSFKRAADDASSYYLLGYYLDTHNTQAGWRDVKVKVGSKDAAVRARRGFFVTKATVSMETTRESDMSFALTTPIEGTGVPLTVSWSGLSPDGEQKKAGFLVHTAANGLAFVPGQQDGLSFDFAALAYNMKDSKQAGQVSFSYAKSVPPDQLATIKQNGVYFQNALKLVPGSYVVRFVVRDNVTGKIGSVTAPLTVD